jgi:hypothetical protein
LRYLNSQWISWYQQMTLALDVPARKGQQPDKHGLSQPTPPGRVNDGTSEDSYNRKIYIQKYQETKKWLIFLFSTHPQMVTPGRYVTDCRR